MLYFKTNISSHESVPGLRRYHFSQLGVGLLSLFFEPPDAVPVHVAEVLRNVDPVGTGRTISAACAVEVGHTAQALELLRPQSAHWKPLVLAASAHEGTGIEALWETICAQRAALEASGERQARRREQARAWMWSLVEEGLREAFRSHPEVERCIAGIEGEVEALETTPAAAARALLEVFRKS